MAETMQSGLPFEGGTPSLANSINDRLSKELVIALVGPVGSGVSTAAGFLKEILTQDYAYDVAPIIKPSDIIRVESYRVNISPPELQPLGLYIDRMQDAGNKLREQFGADYLAKKAVEKIVGHRKDKGGYAIVGEHQIPMPGRRAYLIDSIKNKEELDLLQQIYGETLCVVGIFAPDAIRKQRLIDNGTDKQDVQKILDRDQGEVATFGQMTRKIFVESDFFICNDRKKEELRSGISRYLEIIFDTGVHTPTQAESAMYKANAVASNSACMSRQVGAALVSKAGELIGVGWNDVPKFGGGLYNEDDQSVWDDTKSSIQDKDHRCFKWGGQICHNEVRRNGILDGIAAKLVGSKLLKRGKKLPQVREVLAGTEVDSLTEFSRSIHAEMEAILSVAREGRHSLVGATLYSTTYPCHNCARHIVAAGIAEVVYIQPYAKSLAIALHNDAVTEDRNDRGRVVFRQYDGVAPRKFLKLFCPPTDRKKDGHLSRPIAKVAVPVLRAPLDGSGVYEDKVIADLTSKEQK